MTGVAPSRALDISLGTSVGVGAGVSVSLKRRRSRRQLEFDVHSRSFGVEIDKQIDRERGIVCILISALREDLVGLMI